MPEYGGEYVDAGHGVERPGFDNQIIAYVSSRDTKSVHGLGNVIRV